MKALIFLFTCYGITNMVVFGSIFEKWRAFWVKHSPKFWGKLFTCPMCFGMWVGSILSFLLYLNSVQTPWGSMGLTNHYFIIFLDGCIASGSIWVIHNVEEWFERGNQNAA